MLETPDPDFRAYVDAERDKMRRGVFIVSDVMPYAYTIGNACYGAPELLVIGSADAMIRELLHRLSRMLPRDVPASYDIRPQAKGPTKLRLVDTSAAKAAEKLHNLRIAEYHQAAPFRIMQVLLPDPNGRYPGDPACRDPWSRIPVIGS